MQTIMQTRLDNAFAALQTALLSLEKTIDERKADFATAPTTPPPAGDESVLSDGGMVQQASPQGQTLLTEDEKQAVLAELTELKKLVGEAGALILDAQRNQGTG